MKTTWKVIGRGHAGWHATGLTGENRVSGSGGTLAGYCKEAEDGTIVYDAKEAGNDFVSFVCSGPMLDVSLPDGDVNVFNDHEAMKNMMPGLGGAFLAIGMQEIMQHEKRAKKYGSMDMLSMNLWVALFKKQVPSGVKWGKVVGGAVVWDN